MKFIPPGVPETTGQPGHNEFGVPFHACHGQRHDAHYWAWVGEDMLHRQRRVGGVATSRPRYLAYVMSECLKPGSPFREVEPAWLMLRSSVVGMPITLADAEWAAKTHMDYLHRRRIRTESEE